MKSDPVLATLKYVDLLHDLDPALSEVPLSGDCHLRLVIPLGGLLVFSVGKNNEGDP